MIFNSGEYPIFFLLVLALYWLLPGRLRWVLLLVASYVFYGWWKARYLVLILGSTLLDYWAGLRMGALEEKSRRRPYLLASLAGNLGLLFVFKYSNFFLSSLEELSRWLGHHQAMPTLEVLLPVGISFYTFQSLSYSIDVYRGEREAEQHLGIFALYVSFFPQLVAGPIERSTALLPQFHQEHPFEYGRLLSGSRQFLWGLFKKVVVADRVGQVVQVVFSSPGDFAGFEVLLGAYFFAYQIYCDFSGYSDMAIGSARILGFDLMENFERPYSSRSIGEFWRRWHISLSTWFRDYLYIPLGGSRDGVPRTYRNLFLVFLISGLWHGAAWTFVIWGALHGLFLVSEVATANPRKALVTRCGAWWDQHLEGRPRLRSLVSHLWTALVLFTIFHLVLLGWIFFRAESLADAWLLLGNLGHGWGRFRPWLLRGPYFMVTSLASIVFLELVQSQGSYHEVVERLDRGPRWLRWGFYILLVTWIVVYGSFWGSEFLYFQF